MFRFKCSHFLIIAVLAASTRKAPAQWVHTNGPVGGIVQCFAANENAILAGSPLFGAFRSTDDGISWTKPDSQFANLGISSLAAKGQIFFAGTNKGVYRSTDDGSSWVPCDSGFAMGNRYIISLGTSGNSIFAGTSIYGVYRSTDNGAFWTSADSGLPGSETRAFVAIGNMIFAATSGSGIYRSTDNGATWDSVNYGLSWRSFDCLAANNGTLFTGAYEGGMYRSTDNGANWSKANTGLKNLNIRGLAAGSSNVFAATDSGIFVTSDNGGTWTAAGSWQAFPYTHSICVHGSTAFAGTFGEGIYRSTDNGTIWKPSNTGLINTSVATIAAKNGVLFAGLYNGGLFTSKDKGVTWSPLSSGLRISTEDVYSLGFCGDTMVTATYAGVYLSADNGAAWKKTVADIPENEMVNSFAISGNYVFAGTDQRGIFLTTNYGTNWFAVNSGLGQYPRINCMATSYGVIFAGTVTGIFRTTNGGSSWMQPPGMKNETVYAFAVSDSTIFAGTTNGVKRSINIGVNWDIVNAGLPSGGPTMCLAMSLAASDGHVFAGTYENGIYCSSDNGLHWNPANDGLTVRIRVHSSLAIDGGDLYAGIDNGVWRRPIADMIGVIRRKRTPDTDPTKRFAISLPDGCGSRAIVSVKLCEVETVRITVHDLSGRVLAVLADGRFGPGTHRFSQGVHGSTGGCHIVKICAGIETYIRNIPSVNTHPLSK